MEDFIGFIFCIGILALAVLLPIWLSFMNRRNSALQAVGQRFGGHTSNDNFFSGSRLQFSYGQTYVRVRFRRAFNSYGGKQTEVRLRVPLKFKLEVNYLMGKSRIWWMGSEIHWASDDETFHQMFEVLTNHKSTADRILNAGVRWQLHQLSQLASSGLYFMIDNEDMLVATPKFLTKQQLLDDFVRLVLELYDQIMLAQAVGIDFVEDQTAVIEEVKCPVCSADIVETMVVCLRCKTPHCLDCWKYNGKCATFACGETRYVQPSASKVVRKD